MRGEVLRGRHAARAKRSRAGCVVGIKRDVRYQPQRGSRNFERVIASRRQAGWLAGNRIVVKSSQAQFLRSVCITEPWRDHCIRDSNCVDPN